ncbi:MAG: class I SAM-dependent methyltransferase [Promethearchaeota archaeon]
MECQNCGLTYLKPEEKDLKKYYSEEYRKKHTCIVGQTMECKEMFDLLLPYQQARIEEIKNILNPKMRVLDVGCSTGHFLFVLKDYVQECIGIEYNSQEAEFAKEKLNIKVYTKSIEETDLLQESFDLITIYQVLEHVKDPINFLKLYRKYIKPDGYISIEVPNIQDVLISKYKIKSYEDFWYREPHLFYYSPQTLKMILEKAGFKGSIKGYQRYNILNHMNWIFSGKPQKSVKNGWSRSVLIKDSIKSEESSNELNLWIEKIDEEYKKILLKYNLSDCIIFIGQKTESNN